MQIKFDATANSPGNYAFDNEIITVEYDGQSEEFDLSAIENGDFFQIIVADVLSLPAKHIIRHATRDSDGELWVVLCQTAGEGNWTASDWMEVSAYESDHQYIRKIEQHD